MKFMPQPFGHDDDARIDRLDPRPPRLATSLLALPLRQRGRGRSR